MLLLFSFLSEKIQSTDKSVFGDQNEKWTQGTDFSGKTMKREKGDENDY